jgi:hypothetical protein
MDFYQATWRNISEDIVHRLRVFENRVPRGKIGPKRESIIESSRKLIMTGTVIHVRGSTEGGVFSI